jgi:Protein of unknown function (DUF1467)
MGWVTGIILYVLVWWVTLFAVLPLWVTPSEPGGVGGHMAGDIFIDQLTVAQLSRVVT